MTSCSFLAASQEPRASLLQNSFPRRVHSPWNGDESVSVFVFSAVVAPLQDAFIRTEDRHKVKYADKCILCLCSDVLIDVFVAYARDLRPSFIRR
uniref:Secreted protein n=1 Tax=Steinernema glaseri TaxID=37863 RepID=A0A1I7YTT4_9BILA